MFVSFYNYLYTTDFKCGDPGTRTQKTISLQRKSVHPLLPPNLIIYSIYIFGARLVIFCHSSTLFFATIVAFSRFPSSLRKSSRVVPRAVIDITFIIVGLPTWIWTKPPAPQTPYATRLRYRELFYLYKYSEGIIKMSCSRCGLGPTTIKNGFARPTSQPISVRFIPKPQLSNISAKTPTPQTFKNTGQP